MRGPAGRPLSELAMANVAGLWDSTQEDVSRRHNQMAPEHINVLNWIGHQVKPPMLPKPISSIT